jgi:hypothetical protein
MSQSGTVNSAAGIIGNGANVTPGLGLTTGMPLTTPAKLTISAWIKRNSTANYTQMGWFDVGNRLFGFNFATDGNLYCHCEGGSGASLSIADAFTTLRHYVLVYDGTQTGNANRLKLYRNGVLAAAAYGGTIPATYQMSGTFSPVRPGVGDAIIDEFAVWLDAKSSTQVSALYGGGTPPPFPWYHVA